MGKRAWRDPGARGARRLHAQARWCFRLGAAGEFTWAFYTPHPFSTGAFTPWFRDQRGGGRATGVARREWRGVAVACGEGSQHWHRRRPSVVSKEPHNDKMATTASDDG